MHLSNPLVGFVLGLTLTLFVGLGVLAVLARRVRVPTAKRRKKETAQTAQPFRKAA
jgi:hypothetical protein